jgi:hypothetical protein
MGSRIVSNVNQFAIGIKQVVTVRRVNMDEVVPRGFALAVFLLAP